MTSPNQLIVSLLEKYLEQAKKGDFASIAISVAGHGGTAQHHFTGEVSAEPVQLKSILGLADRLQASIDNWQPYAPDWSLDDSYAFFNCGLAPSGFDFLTWLIVHEMKRVDAKAPGPLKVAFWQGSHPNPNSWVDSVYRPLLGIVGAVEDERAFQRAGSDIYLTKAVVNMFNLGMRLPKLRSVGTYDLPPRDVITITLRECDYWSHRNSNIEAWMLFADLLISRGERVVFVRDTAKADEPLEYFETCPLASRDLDVRMWLYEHAKMNMFVSNGPWMLTVFSECPYVCFVPPEKSGSDYLPNSPLFWKIKMGVEVGDQFPWSMPSQKIVWEKDTFDSIRQAYTSDKLKQAA